MISHAHGQGYADLHFLIPETVGQIDFDKGPYHANKGNLATAEYVGFNTKDRLENSTISLEGGTFDTYKVLGLFNLLNTQKQSAYLAADYLKTDGYFESPQDFKRLNLFGKYTLNFNANNKLSITASTFSSKWNASGQIPQRAVDAGLISRFGAIDSNEGGQTSRSNLNFHYNRSFDQDTWLETTAFYSRYAFELYSNFTFFLNDPINGDQIRQKENRNLAGFESVLNKKYRFSGSELSLQGGVGLRYDDVNNIELSHTINRESTLENIMLGDVNETNGYGYVNAELEFGKLMINPALRLDYLEFRYQDMLNAGVASNAAKATLSPKLNFLYNQSKDLQFFLKLGKGFHSIWGQHGSPQTG
jgi:outer membrane receptor for Fe3+-dicitrate